MPLYQYSDFGVKVNIVNCVTSTCLSLPRNIRFWVSKEEIASQLTLAMTLEKYGIRNVQMIGRYSCIRAPLQMAALVVAGCAGNTVRRREVTPVRKVCE